jgi:hypothetical protein
MVTPGASDARPGAENPGWQAGEAGCDYPKNTAITIAIRTKSTVALLLPRLRCCTR